MPDGRADQLIGLNHHLRLIHHVGRPLQSRGCLQLERIQPQVRLVGRV